MDDKKSLIKDLLWLILIFGTMIGIICLLAAWDDGKLDGTGIDTLLSMLVPAIGVGFMVTLFINMWAYILNKFVQGKIYFIIFVIVTAISYMYISCKPNESEYMPILSIGAWAFIGTLVIRTIVLLIRQKRR